MPKSLPITPEIEASIRRAVNDQNLDVSNFAVFEANFVTTQPLRKSGFYKNGRITRGVLAEMAELINKTGEAIPLQIMHDTDVLSMGKAFEAHLVDEAFPGETALRGMFYIPKTDPEKLKLINDIENSVTDEVSISILSKHALCSECGFDYYGDEASFMNFYDLTCNEGHVLGEDAHIRLTQLDKWFELSAVNRGGSMNAKILSRAKLSMEPSDLERMAASGKPAEMRLLSLSTKMDTPSNKEKTMDLTALTDKVAVLSSDLTKATTELDGVKAERDGLNTKLADANKEITELKAQLAPMAEVQTKLTEAEKQIGEVTTALTEHAKAALVASGSENAEVPTALSEILTLVKDTGLKLHQLVASGAKSKNKPVDLKSTDNDAGSRRAFKVTQ